MGAHHEKTLTFNNQMQPLVDKMRDLHNSGLRLTLKGEVPEGNNGVCFQITHGVTATSWGEKITVKLVPTGPAQTMVTINSRCALPTQIVDWGKNKSNVEKLFQYLSK